MNLLRFCPSNILQPILQTNKTSSTKYKGRRQIKTGYKQCMDPARYVQAKTGLLCQVMMHDGMEKRVIEVYIAGKRNRERPRYRWDRKVKEASGSLRKKTIWLTGIPCFHKGIYALVRKFRIPRIGMENGLDLASYIARNNEH